jgi:hypothetical protein
LIRRIPSLTIVAAIILLAGAAIAQFQGQGFGPRFGRRGRGYSRGYDPNEPVDRKGIPDWKNDERFQKDVFTFARVKYGYNGGWGKWRIDYPDSDLNFSYRLHQLTALETDPNGKIVELTDDALYDYPFLYLIEPGDMELMEDEVLNLRKYLLNGGFLMVDDFWGEWEWQTFYEQIKRVFPDREPIELPLEHEIFHIVYDLKEKPLVPSVGYFRSGMRTERADAQEAHYRAIFDDNGRIMALICHNTDLGDGWEQEGADPDYFKAYAEKWSYPMGINIITYAMTH